MGNSSNSVPMTVNIAASQNINLNEVLVLNVSLLHHLLSIHANTMNDMTIR